MENGWKMGTHVLHAWMAIIGYVLKITMYIEIQDATGLPPTHMTGGQEIRRIYVVHVKGHLLNQE